MKTKNMDNIIIQVANFYQLINSDTKLQQLEIEEIIEPHIKKAVEELESKEE